MKFHRSLIMLVLLQTSCTCSEPKQSFETVDDARKTAMENSLTLAKQWRAENKMTEWNIEKRGDSTIDASCPQGDGWASLDLKKTDSTEVLKIKCSTVSAGLGCLRETDFKERENLASQEGKCNKDIPFPLPKISN